MPVLVGDGTSVGVLVAVALGVCDGVDVDVAVGSVPEGVGVEVTDVAVAVGVFVVVDVGVTEDGSMVTLPLLRDTERLTAPRLALVTLVPAL